MDLMAYTATIPHGRLTIDPLIESIRLQYILPSGETSPTPIVINNLTELQEAIINGVIETQPTDDQMEVEGELARERLMRELRIDTGLDLPEAPPEVITHACPPGSSNVTPCCGRTPWELLSSRMTLDPALVTCRGHLDTEQKAE